MLISLVSGTYNRLPLLKDMVQSFRDNLFAGMTYEIVLVDGGSTDGTIEWAKAQRDMVLIEDGKLLGAISAFTRGAYAAKGKYVLLANDDIEFKSLSVLPAITYLETNFRAGAVAFEDNRPTASFSKSDYHTLSMSALVNGRRSSVIYAQVGLFRKWLGDLCGWWLGPNNEMAGAAVYAGDNSLSAQIWNRGYSVDAVVGCRVEDHVAADELRQINFHKGRLSDDSQHFYKQWPQGVIVSAEPVVRQQDKRAARILYLPIYEPGWPVQKHPVYGKHGLRDALAKATNKFGQPHIVQEVDYLSIPADQLRQRLLDITDAFKPDMILSQIQSPRPLTADILSAMKQRTGASVINWNGDQAIGGLYSQDMLSLLRQFDLQLITNLDVVKDYDREGIRWDYWQIGYEDCGKDYQKKADQFYADLGRRNPFEDDPKWPVVYLASIRSEERKQIANLVEAMGGRVFSPGDEFASLYNFPVNTAIYKRAQVIVSDNGFTSRGFVSNRLFQALGAGGGVVLQQNVEGLDELTGLKAETHYVSWISLEGLKAQIEWALSEVKQAKRVAQAGSKFVQQNYSFDAQVSKLMDLIRKHLGQSERLVTSVALRYIGRSRFGFGLGNSFPSGQRYEYTPDRLLYVQPQDIETVMALYPGQWEHMELESEK